MDCSSIFVTQNLDHTFTIQLHDGALFSFLFRFEDVCGIFNLIF